MIYVHDDPSKWGREVAMAAGRAGIPIMFFKKPQEVPEGAVAFVRLDQFKERRDVSKHIIQILHEKGVRTLPSLEDARLYDDKIAQYEELHQFMPETHVVYSAADARKLLNNFTLPIVSKSAAGANAANVRLIQSIRQAHKEIALAFEGRGIPMTYDRRQKGYLYWQRFVPDNARDYRIIIVGDYGWGLVRENRRDVPFASGSGVNRTLTLETEHERLAYELGWQVKDHMKTEMIGMDIVMDGDTPLLLETTSSWTIGHHVTGPVFDRHGVNSPYVRGHQWDLVALVLKRLLEGADGQADGYGVAPV